MNRKDFLRSLGFITAGAAVIGGEQNLKAAGKAMGIPMEDPSMTDPEVDFPVKGLKASVNGPVKVIIIGAGNRGRTYANYAKVYPECMQIVGVSDIRESRKNAMGDNFNIPEEHRFGDWSEVFTVPKFADAVVISTPDDTHYHPCMKALEWGYDVLLEKPVAQSEKECTDIAAQAHKYGGIVAVCHVLRYSPYFRAMYEAIHTGLIGKLISIQHMEPIECRHMAHSYVRGNWRDSKKTTPIILAKSCHDLDILRWFVGKPCRSIVAD
ncbi:MAG: Gfo/Idh/MocA family protein, partial [Candidatus Cryptobacteroides sp.]